MKRENFSRKREAILQKIRGSHIHPTAEWVYQELKNEYPDLSLGTVYRNLTRFKEDGTIRSLGVINGQEHFDGELNAHDHFLCVECGQILDLARPAFLEESIEHLEKTGNLVVRSYDLLLRGTCPACCKKQKQ
ncbi:MAG: transcriptional repressor [Clostridia bacterium]|nr:transcriptional repressor [Clostridia bacterium]MDY5558081.1 transcriptional repressor [Candidatus Heritagella sp.]